MSARNITIVDDELSMRTYIQMMLEGQAYNLSSCNSGVALLEMLKHGAQPDLIILDVVMPQLNGFETCEQLKAHPQWRHIPVILVTVLDAKEALVKGMEAGADDFLQKPVNKLELITRVRSMLRIKQQYDELEKTLRLREQLTNMIVHDMSSPITSIQLHTALMAENTTDINQREHLDMIRLSAERLDGFVSDMLMMAKLKQSKLHLNKTPVDILDLLQEAEKNFTIIAHSKNIHLSFQLPEESKMIELDESLFSRVVANLFSNALQYSPANSEVTVTLEYIASTEQSVGIHMEVKDQGVGIPACDRKRIFDQYEVVELKKKGLKQIGLGLTFCKMVVDAHDGNIHVRANQPTGTIFSVEIN
ncbi:hybrid sensor histidine kinase/response regulator [Candidatus Venteria ishoeyi]|uniref:histidine kinase n=1 Tax=Candidatus Venteria ishoeyi TaxID=1899563 RepID=A0A1H6F2Z6_9GAMM|nr:hybrid sensor histidine kinase/response regulator [Candidatus Venteria ishoeyi]MDM8547574.1 hybrid sensor histidine kinase/response regulator [Candidatus Venteria ishoeyi]SEH04538.1 Response regulator PleD [Candidatus Venteria ishoeyi]